MISELGSIPSPNLVSNEYLELIRIIDDKFDTLFQRVKHIENCFCRLASNQRFTEPEDALIFGLQRRICDLEEKL
jgi:hypothetical protein